MLLYHSFGQEDFLSYCISYMNMLNSDFPGFEPIPRLSVTYDRSVVSPGTPVSFTNKTDHHDIIEIIVKSGLKYHNANPWYRRFIELLHIIYEYVKI